MAYSILIDQLLETLSPKANLAMAWIDTRKLELQDMDKKTRKLSMVDSTQTLMQINCMCLEMR